MKAAAARGLRSAQAPETKNAPEPAATGIEGSDQRTLSKEKNLMNDMVDQTTDNAPINLDADLTEFEQYAREHFPKVSPKSPYYKLEERAYDYSTWVGYDEIRAKLFPHVPVPVWHSTDAADSLRRDVPIMNAFVSDAHTVLLSRERGVKDDRGITCGHWGARLLQNLKASEPMIQTWTRCIVETSEGRQMGYAADANTRMTLDEAVEIANLLLLLVDVARDTTVRGGE